MTSPPEEVITTSDFKARMSEIMRRVADGESFAVRHYSTIVARIVPTGHPVTKETRMTAPVTTRPATAVLYNQAGGSCKTSLVRDLAYDASQRNLRVLVIDADPQGSLTRWLGGYEVLDERGRVKASRLENTIFDVITGRTEELPTPLTLHGLDLIPGNREMESANVLLSMKSDLMTHLRDAIDQLGDRYDLVIIDTPPADSALVTTCMVAADTVFTPVSASKGLDRLDTVMLGMKRAQAYNPTLTFGGFMPSNLHLRQAPGGAGYTRGHFSDVLDALRSDFAGVGPTFSEIRARPALFNDAAASMLPVQLFKPNHEVVVELSRLGTEFLNALGFVESDVTAEPVTEPVTAEQAGPA